MANSDKNIRITPNRGQTALPNIVFTGSAAGTSVITLSVLDDNTVSFGSTEGQVFSLDSNLTSGTIWSVTDVSGIPLLRASAGATVGIAEYVGSTVGIGTENPGPYKLNVRGPIAFGSTADGGLNFIYESLAAGSGNFQVRSANSIRFYRSTNANFTALTAGAQGFDYTLTLPTTQPGSGTSYLIIIPSTSTTGTLAWAPGVRRKTHRIQFAAALNPVTGADNAEFEIPFVQGGTSFTSANFRMVRLHTRVGTAAAVGSSFRVEKYAWRGGLGVTAFNTDSAVFIGSTTNILSSAVIIQGATTYEVENTNWAGIHVTATSGDKLRLNWLQASNTQYNFSINLYMEEDV